MKATRITRWSQAAFLTRLQMAGFGAITLHVAHELIFIARREESS